LLDRGIGRGVDVPMPAILVGALSGMATGDHWDVRWRNRVLALAWQVVTGWVNENPKQPSRPEADFPPHDKN
jgi:hypothetical protein